MGGEEYCYRGHGHRSRCGGLHNILLDINGRSKADGMVYQKGSSFSPTFIHEDPHRLMADPDPGKAINISCH